MIGSFSPMKFIPTTSIDARRAEQNASYPSTLLGHCNVIAKAISVGARAVPPRASLPRVNWQQIFSYLPMKDFLIARRICKASMIPHLEWVNLNSTLDEKFLIYINGGLVQKNLYHF